MLTKPLPVHQPIIQLPINCLTTLITGLYTGHKVTANNTTKETINAILTAFILTNLSIPLI